MKQARALQRPAPARESAILIVLLRSAELELDLERLAGQLLVLLLLFLGQRVDGLVLGLLAQAGQLLPSLRGEAALAPAPAAAEQLVGVLLQLLVNLLDLGLLLILQFQLLDPFGRG